MSTDQGEDDIESGAYLWIAATAVTASASIVFNLVRVPPPIVIVMLSLVALSIIMLVRKRVLTVLEAAGVAFIILILSGITVSASAQYISDSQPPDPGAAVSFLA